MDVWRTAPNFATLAPCDPAGWFSPGSCSRRRSGMDRHLPRSKLGSMPVAGARATVSGFTWNRELPATMTIGAEWDWSRSGLTPISQRGPSPPSPTGGLRGGGPFRITHDRLDSSSFLHLVRPRSSGLDARSVTATGSGESAKLIVSVALANRERGAGAMALFHRAV